MRGVRRLLMAVVLLLALEAPAQAADVRVFAVGNKQRVADAVTYKTFSDKMGALMDAGYPGRAGLVQAGVDDVASHVRPADPTAPERALVVFPEDVGLAPSLIGSRGAFSRTQTAADFAILFLIGPYTPQITHYSNRFPGQPGFRPLALALTDTLYRSFYETFRGLAIEHHVFIAAAMNAPPARRVEQADDPGLVALLRDPDEPSRTYAYEAVSPDATNTTYVFGPDGEVLVPDGEGGTLESPSQTGGVIRGSLAKAYLTPTEQPPPATTLGLSLAFGHVNDQEVLDTPVGRLGSVISKDAWMVDVNDRLAAKGANVMLQPEAFSEWGYATSPWQPDIFKEGGFANLQKIPSLKLNVTASMTGNFFDATFDGQSAIIARKQKTSAVPLGPDHAWIGQNPDTGFRRVAPWIEPDPGIAEPGLTLAQRRARLAASGVRLINGRACGGPLAVGACLNGYRESVIWKDATLPDGPVTAPVDRTRERPPRFAWSVRASGGERAPAAQHAPAVAASGPRVYAVWYESRGGLDNVWMAVSHNGGKKFKSPVRISDNAAGTVEELNPAVAAQGKDVVIAWQEFAQGRDDNRGRVKLAHFGFNGRKHGRDVRVDDSDGGGKWLPAVSFAAGRPLVVWIDERDRGPEGEPLEHVYSAREDAGGRFARAVRVDTGSPVALSLHLDNRWSPTVTAAGDRVYVAWADFRDYNWDIYSARSDDAGRTFSDSHRVDDFQGFERINERPTLGIGAGGVLHAAWTDLRAREPDTNIFYARSGDRGATFSPARQLDDSKQGFDPDTDTPTNQWHPSMVVLGKRLYVAWQDNRLGNNDIFFTASADGGESFGPAERVDDTGAGQSEQSSPDLVWSHGSCFAAWEDDRNATSDVFVARRACPGG